MPTLHSDSTPQATPTGVPAHLAALCAVSRRIGADAALVQGAGGNTSLKRDGVLWVKASGRWLARAAEEPMFVPLDLAALHTGIDAGDDTAAVRAVIAAQCPAGLRASIETSLHALLPHPVVLHAHSVAALAWLVCEGIDAPLGALLHGLRWARLPYVRPGLSLTLAVRDRLRNDAVDVLLLDNHGIVVGADTPVGAEALLRDVHARLDRVRPPRAGDGFAAATLLATALERTGYRLPADPACHALALDAAACRFAAGGAPWPDHVVFLGAGLPVLDPADRQQPWLARLAESGAPAVIVAGAGVLVHRSLDVGGQAMLRCLADVALRLPADAAVRYLPGDEVQALQHWEAERFRRSQTGPPSGHPA